MTDQQQSPFVGQVWQRRNDWWRYVVILVAIIVAKKVFVFFWRPFSSEFGMNGSLEYILSNYIGLAILMLLFKPLHEAPVTSLFSVFKKIRPAHFLWGLGMGLVAFIAEPLTSILFSDIESVKWIDNPLDFVKALVSGIFLGIGYATFSVIQLGYLLPGLIKWVKRPLVAGIMIWLYANISYIWYLLFQGGGLISMDTIQFLFGSLPFLLILVAWVLMDDSIEIIAGLMIGASIVGNVIIKLGNGVGSWGRTIVEVSLVDNNIDYLAGSIIRSLALILFSIILYKKIPWKNWRNRLLSRYETPAVHDEWKDRIDEIGGGNEK